MERLLWYLRIYPGAESAFDGVLRTVPPELQEAVRSAGLRDVSVFRRGTDSWCYAAAHPDRATVTAALGAAPAVIAWTRGLATLVAESTDGSGHPLEYAQVFHTDGAGEGPMTRGSISLVVAPDGIPRYEALHADPWPDMLEALAQSGYRNYSGFRRGNHVVYYGEYHPDLKTVSERMSAREVNARWGRAFDGIITLITTANGELITADEVYHQD